MLEIATTGPAYKDLLDALGKLADWMEQAGKGDLPSGSPPEELVQQFNAAFEKDVTADVTSPLEALSPTQTTPLDVISQSDLFQSEPRRDVSPITDVQEINLDRGLEALDSASAPQTKEPSLVDSIQGLTELLSKPAESISPVDLLQVQRFMGVLKLHAETGRKVSEGISDTAEQLLEQQG